MLPPLEQLLPQAFRHETHRRAVAAPQAVVRAAIERVDLHDLPLTRLLMGIRSLGRWRGTGKAIDALPPRVVAEDDDSLLMTLAIHRRARRTEFPTVDHLNGYAEPGWLVIGMDLRVTAEGERSLISTQTAVRATDPGTRRIFAAYWFLIRAGSGLIRRELLRAIARRAEAPRTAPS